VNSNRRAEAAKYALAPSESNNMADVYSARGDMEKKVFNAIAAIPFPKGAYTHDDAAKLKRALGTILQLQFNRGNPAGMKGFLTATDPINDIKSTDYEDASAILTEFRLKAAAETTALRAIDATAPAVVPEISSRSDANEEANIRNTANQAVIGCKEAIIRGIVHLVGTSITDSILKEPTTNDPKNVDAVAIADLFTAIENNAVRPTPIDVLTKCTDLLWRPFNFQEPCVNNIEALKKEAGLLAALGITIDNSQLAANILANVTHAAKQSWGRDFEPALRTLRRTYAHNHQHDATSIAAIAQELALVDGVRSLRDAEPISLSRGGSANAVRAEFEHLNALIQSAYDTDEEDGTAAAADSDSDESGTASRVSRRSTKSDKGKAGKEKAEKDRGRNRRRKEKDGGRSRSNAKDASWKDNPCPHCRKFKRHKQHPKKDAADCQWNEAYVGWRPKFICDEMRLEYIPKHEFSDEE
jgi:hypothetical protein